MLRRTGDSNAHGCQFIEYKTVMGSRKMTALISLRVSGRVRRRFTQHAGSCSQNTKHEIDVMSKCPEDVVRTFQLALVRCFSEKVEAFTSGRTATMYTLSPTFYKLWMAVCREAQNALSEKLTPLSP